MGEETNHSKNKDKVYLNPITPLPKTWILNISGGSSWTAGQSDFGQYLIIDLGEKKNISSIASQGKPYTAEYVQEFRLDYGNDGQDFANYRDRNGNIKVRPEMSHPPQAAK